MKVQNIVPLQHMLQIVYQCFVLNVNIAVYACVWETALLCPALISVSNEDLQRVRDMYAEDMHDCFQLAQDTTRTVLSYASPWHDHQIEAG